MNNRREINCNWAHPWTLVNGHMRATGTIMRQGVFCGSKGCILHSGETIKNSVKNWANIPVTIDHPMIGNSLISVKEKPEAVIGHLENPQFRNGALMADIVITTNDQNIRQQLQNTRELSIGVFTEEIEASGIYEGKGYSAIAQYYKADHLALLPNGVGACSWERGECGIGLVANADIWREAIEQIINDNKERNNSMEKNILMPSGLTVNEEEDEKALQALREEADQKGILLPAQFNVTGTKKAEHQEANILLPTGLN